MTAFTVVRETPLPPEQAWARITDWRAHERFVPFTRITVDTPGGNGVGNGVGTRFTARTAAGRVGFDDIMEVVEWEAPRRCRLEKRGTAILGWAELTVEPSGTGSRVRWTEEARPARLPRFARRANDEAGRLLFGRVLKGLLSAP